MIWREALDRAVAEATDDELADLLGDLERARAKALTRLQTPRNGSPAPQADGRLLSTEEAAAKLAVSTRWVQRHKRELGVIELSERCLRFPIEAVNDYISRRRPK